MTIALTLLALALAPQTNSASPFTVLRTWTGKAYDHLGIGISALGDVNGDGSPDFILGAMQGAYTFAFGPGYAEVVSGKDGSVLYSVRGTNKDGDCGDAYGDSLAMVGDLDKDGVPDFAVGAWRYEAYRGYVAIYSGRSGSPLATLYGGGTLRRGEGPVPPVTCEGFGVGLGKHIVPLGDTDGDSVPDFSIGDDSCVGPSRIVSGADFSVRECLSGLVIAPAGQGTGVVLVRESGGQVELVTAHNLEKPVVLSKLLSWSTHALCDMDRDGWTDLVAINDRIETGFDGSGPATSMPVRFLSGKDGTVLRKLELKYAGVPQGCSAGVLADLNGDARPEVFVRAFVHTLGSSIYILDGQTGAVLAHELHSSWTYGRQIIPVGDVDHDGSQEFLLSDYEAQEGTQCGGAVHLIRIRLSSK